MRHVTRRRDVHARALEWSDRLPVDPDVDATADDAAHHLRVVLLVFAGGCAGGLTRYLVVRQWPDSLVAFPWSTFTVNLVGAFLLACVVELATEVLQHSRYLRPLVGAGFCGALTTFSSLVVTADRQIAHGHVALAAGYLVLTAAGGLTAGALGLTTTRLARRW